VSLRWSIRPEWCLRGSVESNLRSSPFYRPGAPSYATPLSPPRVRDHLSKGMWLAALHHTKMDGELPMIQAVVSFAMESTLGRKPNDTFHVEVVGELVAEFQKLE
jgi:hypothetical protein